MADLKIQVLNQLQGDKKFNPCSHLSEQNGFQGFKNHKIEKRIAYLRFLCIVVSLNLR